jgi:hypothetical protein
MTRTRSGKSLTELLVIVAVLAGLGWMLTHAVQRVCASATNDRPSVTASVSLKAPPPRGRLP